MSLVDLLQHPLDFANYLPMMSASAHGIANIVIVTNNKFKV